MIHSLTDFQLSLLRRSRTGLRVWEQGAALAALHDELRTLAALGLVEFDATSGYQLTPPGQSCLRRLELGNGRTPSAR
jgi:DNA-binding IclR family transcriptional regulator